MAYTEEEFVVDLRNIKPVDYFISKPLPNTTLATVIKETRDTNIIDYYSDKLSTDGAIHNAILLDNIAVANSLLSKGVTYDADKLVFRYWPSVEWGIQQGIKFHVKQLPRYNIDADVVKLVLKYQPELLHDMNLTKCNDNVLQCVISHSDLVITDELITYICFKGCYKSFVELAKHIDMEQYLHIIASGTPDIIDYTLSTCNLTIDSFPVDKLFSGIYICNKVIKYHSSIANLQDIINNGLLQQLFDNKDFDAIVYLGERYTVNLPELSYIETVRLAMVNQLDIEANDGFNDKDVCLANRQDILTMDVCDISDLYKKYNALEYF